LASNIAEDASTWYQNKEKSISEILATFSTIMPHKIEENSKMEEYVLIERLLRFNWERIAVIISEFSCEEEVLEDLSENMIEENGTSYLMKESTKYDLAMSDKTSVFSSGVGHNKSGYDESMDLICLEISNLSWKIDLWPKNNEKENKNLEEIFNYFSIPEITSNFHFFNNS